MNENLKNLNSSVASYEKVSQIQLYPTEFEKTPKGASNATYITVLQKISMLLNIQKVIKRG